MVLKPLEIDENSDSELEVMKSNYERVRMKLAEFNKSPPENMTFDKFSRDIEIR